MSILFYEKNIDSGVFSKKQMYSARYSFPCRSCAWSLSGAAISGPGCTGVRRLDVVVV